MRVLTTTEFLESALLGERRLPPRLLKLEEELVEALASDRSTDPRAVITATPASAAFNILMTVCNIASWPSELEAPTQMGRRGRPTLRPIEIMVPLTTSLVYYVAATGQLPSRGENSGADTRSHRRKAGERSVSRAQAICSDFFHLLKAMMNELNPTIADKLTPDVFLNVVAEHQRQSLVKRRRGRPPKRSAYQALDISRFSNPLLLGDIQVP